MDEPRDSPLLRVSALQAGYLPDVRVLFDIGLDVFPGEVVTLLGRNGAGKSTLIRVISGLLPPVSGSVHFAGRDITRDDSTAIVKGGIAVVPEGRRVFGSLSVEENILIGGFSHRRGIVPRPAVDRIYTAFPHLAKRRKQRAGTLSGGEQQMVAMGRALMAEPRLLLLDEPSMGLAPMLIEAVFDMISTLAAGGMTILLVEQNAAAALDVADRAYVLEQGQIVQAAAAAELQQDSGIRASYLGLE